MLEAVRLLAVQLRRWARSALAGPASGGGRPSPPCRPRAGARPPPSGERFGPRPPRTPDRSLPAAELIEPRRQQGRDRGRHLDLVAAGRRGRSSPASARRRAGSPPRRRSGARAAPRAAARRSRAPRSAVALVVSQRREQDRRGVSPATRPGRPPVEQLGAGGQSEDGAPAAHPARSSIRSSSAGSAQCRSSKTTITGASRPSRSNVRRIAQLMSAAAAAAPPSPRRWRAARRSPRHRARRRQDRPGARGRDRGRRRRPSPPPAAEISASGQ